MISSTIPSHSGNSRVNLSVPDGAHPLELSLPLPAKYCYIIDLIMEKTDKSRIRQLTRQASKLALHYSQWVLCHLPRWTITLLMTLIFPIAYLFMGRLRNIAQINFQSVYGPDKDTPTSRQMTSQCLRQTGRTMIDLLYFVERPQLFSQQVIIHGEDHLIRALDQKKGVIVYTAHLNNFPLMFVALVQKGYPVNFLIRPMRDPEFSRFMFDLCAKWHINMIPTKPRRDFLRRSYAALENNELLFIMMDESPPDNKGTPVPFLGQTVKRAPGPLLFYKKFQSPVLPMFIVQDEQRRFHVYVEPEIKIVEGTDRQDFEERNTASMTAVIEKYVRKYPLQWGGWLNKRWSETSALPMRPAPGQTD
ncbi:MAG: lysophospholipid acyltransferase family protein [Candidatus Omnitrophica bacterium]|nr:lysophospholipid acyltransferase family protein [Candidatus Omnitrophota bacterium]